MARGEESDHDDSDIDSREDSQPPGKPGRKKNPNSQAARRDQNRIAQREFRLRKQQRIRDLEAKVEILSGGKDEALGEMRNILKDLMHENQTLRNLLRSVAGFIGEGAGGLLPRLGWQMADFNDFVNKSETDIAWEGYQQRKKMHEQSATTLGTKRASEDDGPPSSRAKKAREDATGSGTSTDPLNNMMFPMQQSPSSLGYPPVRTPSDNNSMFGNNSGMFVSPGPSGAPYPGASPVTNYASQQSFVPGINLNVDPSITSLPFPNTAPPKTATPPSAAQQQQQQQQAPRQASLSSIDQLDDDDDPGKNEAYKLIHYHLDNYKRNSAYCLPASLRPTLVQRTVPHEGVIDRILHPELRDRMILLRGRFDLVDCLLDYRNAVTIHGDDVLAHANWEIGEKWLRRYGFLVDTTTLSIMNRWRRERGEPELLPTDIGANTEQPPSMS